MPYQNEFSKHKTITDLVNNQKVKNFLSEMKIITREKSNFEKIDNRILIKKENLEEFKSEERLQYVFAFDGSKTQIELNSGFPGAEVGILKINQTFIELELMKKYENEAFPHPKEYDEIFLSQTFDVTIPGFNVCSEIYQDPQDFFRFAIFNFIENNYNKFIDILNEKSDLKYSPEMFLETYKKMLSKKTENISCSHPCEYCSKGGSNMLSVENFKEDGSSYLSNKIKCSCKHNPKDLFITDLLHFHEGFSNAGSNEGLYTQVMSFFEKLIFINLIENLNSFFSESNGFNKNILFEKCAFILDGPLAVYNYASWFATSISDRLIELNDTHDLLIIGVEKSGHFMQHLENQNSVEKDGDKPLENGFIFFLEDNYIKRYVKYSTSPIPYGKNFYFGKKMFYKNYDNQLFVINISFNSLEDRENYINARTDINYELTQNRLKDIVWIFERYSSSRFKNALSFISVAHENASISSNYFSKRVISNFVEDAISKD